MGINIPTRNELIANQVNAMLFDYIGSLRVANSFSFVYMLLYYEYNLTIYLYNIIQVPMERMAEHFGANSLQYLSLEGLKSAVRVGIKETNSTGHCTGQ